MAELYNCKITAYERITENYFKFRLFKYRHPEKDGLVIYTKHGPLQNAQNCPKGRKKCNLMECLLVVYNEFEDRVTSLSQSSATTTWGKLPELRVASSPLAEPTDSEQNKLIQLSSFFGQQSRNTENERDAGFIDKK